MTANQIAYWSLQETKRSNQVRERETQRSNMANEGLKAQLNEGQLDRWSTQNGTDIANATTGGIANILKGVGSLSGLIKGGKK